MRARVVLFGSVAVAVIGGALNGCGGRLLPGNPGSAGTGGSTTAGGTTGTGGASGSGSASDSGGAADGGNTAGRGGGTGGSAHTPGFGEPACPPGVGRLSECTPADLQFCYRRCGPENVGVTALTCQTSGQLNGHYSGMSECTFDPVVDYACYKIPTVANAACPAGVSLDMSLDLASIQHSMACDVPVCTLCNYLQGTPGGTYLDSTGAPKVGWCVCQPANSAGLRTWSCASETSWPCPLGAGC